MISENDKAAVFQSIPKEIVVGEETYDVYVDYASRCKVSENLKDYPLVVTIRYFGDHRDEVASPTNNLLRKETVGANIRYVKGEIEQATLSINVHARDNHPDYVADTLLDAYIDALQIWSIRDLPKIVGVAGKSPASDLSFLEESSRRRHMDVYVRYDQAYLETVTTIETVETGDVQVTDS